ncbi:SDR family NAD(P)-dependent oxidoreductase [Robertkochia aurantiaca]|uniref:SDR family NAD(P)-dependent oxidoreductase n=1 Tax=Robertkochia aurantiaca TaxID=2873700 RepID=UPI001CCC4AF3|nr:SDR family NAD(P)-dependent oxidoreductase [Robertkochia sp. 3YJGBD-33]
MELKGKKVLITGGSAGIGKAIIKKLHDQGVNEFATMGRRLEPLNTLRDDFPDCEILTVQGDVSKIDDLNRLINTVREKWDKIDILINNAGVVSAAPLQEMTDDDIQNQITINLTAVALLTKRALPLLQNSSEAAIVNVSSGLGYVAMPFYSVYAATKAGLRQFSDALRRELIRGNIHVMTVYPTATDTDMMKTANAPDMDSPEKVADHTIEGLREGAINVILGGEEKKQQIKLNQQEPEKVDQMMASQYDALKSGTKNHRAM